MKNRSVLAILTTTVLLAWCAKPATPEAQTETWAEVTVTTQETIPTPVQETTPTQEVAPTEAKALPTYTLADVATHNEEASCWTAINGQVYDLTAFIKKHPGGDRNILRICGIDGSQAFNAQHGGKKRPEETLAWFEIGVLSK